MRILYIFLAKNKVKTESGTLAQVALAQWILLVSEQKFIFWRLAGPWPVSSYEYVGIGC